MRSPGARRAVACLCIAVVLVAALMPAGAMLAFAIPEPGWVVLPALTAPTESLPLRVFAGVGAALGPPLPGRAPPTGFLRA